jgi:hypothetical protein
MSIKQMYMGHENADAKSLCLVPERRQLFWGFSGHILPGGKTLLLIDHRRIRDGSLKIRPATSIVKASARNQSPALPPALWPIPA